jgi:hypothetical protein
MDIAALPIGHHLLEVQAGGVYWHRVFVKE